MGLKQAPTTRIIVGSNSAIAKSFITTIQESEPHNPIVSISSSADSDFQCDYSEDAIAEVIESLPSGSIHLHIFNGQLCLNGYSPEKRLDQLDYDYFSELMRINCWIPLSFISKLSQRLIRSDSPEVSVMSARVGSIADNRLGGWYSYRASKAALNQSLNTAAIEISRRNPGAKFLAFHPGTTRSNLSAPFQRNVPKNKLFEPDFVGSQLHKVLLSLESVGHAQFVDWDGKSIQW